MAIFNSYFDIIVVSIMVSSSAAANVASKDGFYVGFHSAPSNMAFHSGFSAPSNMAFHSGFSL